MKISIIGSGYVGLVTGVCLASLGHKIICVDKQKNIVTMINEKHSPIYEPKLNELLEKVISQGNLVATQDTNKAIQNTDITIVAVPTPQGEEGIDLYYIGEASKEIGLALREKANYHVVCIKSTVVPSTTDTFVANAISEFAKKSLNDFGLCMNPEFLREGNAVDDFMNPDRIVIGAIDDKSFSIMEDVYSVFKDATILRTNLRTAEMIKYTMNSLLALLISFSNEIGNVCEAIQNIDIKDVLYGVGLDSRFNPKVNGTTINPGLLAYLAAGCGFGGSCFPKDTNAFISFSDRKGYTPEIVKAAVKVNESQPARLVQRIEKEIGSLSNKKIAILGLAFKPETDDIRESPSIKIIEKLAEKGAYISACDPVAVENTARRLRHLDVVYSRDYKDVLRDSEACILVTKWQEYKIIQPDEFKQLMKTPVIFDGRRIYDKELFRKSGIQYFGIGLVEI